MARRSAKCGAVGHKVSKRAEPQRPAVARTAAGTAPRPGGSVCYSHYYYDDIGSLKLIRSEFVPTPPDTSPASPPRAASRRRAMADPCIMTVRPWPCPSARAARGARLPVGPVTVSVTVSGPCPR